MKKLMIAGLVALAGCATLSVEEAYAIASRSPDWELCYVAVSGRGPQNLRNAVYSVMQSRRTDCSQHAALVAARMQQDQANNAASAKLGADLINAGRPRPTASPSTVCQSRWNGSTFKTVCD